MSLVNRIIEWLLALFGGQAQRTADLTKQAEVTDAELKAAVNAPHGDDAVKRLRDGTA